MKFSISLNSFKIPILIFYLILFTLPFGIKKFLFSFRQPINEFNSLFLYASDILIFIFLIFSFYFYRPLINVKKLSYIFLLCFLFISFFSIFWSNYQIFSLVNFLRLVLIIGFSLMTGFLLKEKKVSFSQIMKILAFSGILQAILAIIQFRLFESLGLRLLGEPVVNLFTENVARYRIDRLVFLRSFGTFPHSNILGAFLIFLILSFFYLFLKRNLSLKINWREIALKTLIALCLFLAFLAFIFTFSRSSWGIGAFLFFLFLVYGLFDKNFRLQTFQLLVILTFIFSFLLFNFSWLIFPRVHLSLSEPSVVYRLIYNKIGFEIIKNNLEGIGLGNFVLYSLDQGAYLKEGIESWINWQPVHNVFILISSEIGILGLIFFVLFLVSLIFEKIKIWSVLDIHQRLKLFTSFLIFFGFIIFGFFDHFIWTLSQGRLMFWLVIGFIIGIGPHSSKERAQASGA